MRLTKIIRFLSLVTHPTEQWNHYISFYVFWVWITFSHIHIIYNLKWFLTPQPWPWSSFGLGEWCSNEIVFCTHQWFHTKQRKENSSQSEINILKIDDHSWINITFLCCCCFWYPWKKYVCKVENVFPAAYITYTIKKSLWHVFSLLNDHDG